LTKNKRDISPRVVIEGAKNYTSTPVPLLFLIFVLLKKGIDEESDFSSNSLFKSNYYFIDQRS
jgi:hypothetical protein